MKGIIRLARRDWKMSERESLLEEIDDKIFDIMLLVNFALDLDCDISNMDQTEATNSIKEHVVNILQESVED